MSRSEAEAFESIRQFREAVEQSVGGQRVGVDAGIAVACQCERHGSWASGCRVVLVVADHGARRGAGAEFGNDAQEVTGIGLSDCKPVAAADAVEERQETHTLQYCYRRALWLVWGDRGVVAALPPHRPGVRQG